MQKASKAYKDAMKLPFRNRAYINVVIGVINQNAQKTAHVDEDETPIIDFSSPSKPFSNYQLDALYATAEQGFSKVDGSMIFLPRDTADAIYNNGIITENLLGSVLIKFGITGLDIKGLTIDFGECYPTEFIIENDSGSKTYSGNTLQRWSTEDVFENTSYLKIIPIKMVTGQNRLRIYEFLCGIGNVFTNNDVKSCTWKDYISPISENLPSQDLSLTVYNYSQKYNADNPKSALNFMELGQEISVSFGYDVTGNGEVVWIDSVEAYLKSWDADDAQAKFTATDRFDNINSMYYRGKYRKNGITAYDLAVDILADMGLEEKDYSVDSYLKGVLIYNPMPVVAHVEALQILANACRCVLSQNRSKKIQIKSSFQPDMMASSDNQMFYSHVENILSTADKTTYAIAFNDYARVNGNMLFLPRNIEELHGNTGYISESVCDEFGVFENNPIVEIALESVYTCYGMKLEFNTVAPADFIITSYYEDVRVQTISVSGNEETTCIITDALESFDKLTIEFVKGHPNSRIVLDSVVFGDVTDYHLQYMYDLKSTPKGIKQEKVKSINVIRTNYSESVEDEKEIANDEVEISEENNVLTILFGKAVYSISAVFVQEQDGAKTYLDTLENGISMEIIDSSDYFATILFSNVQSNQVVKIAILGKEYQINENNYHVKHSTIGEEIQWKNALISTVQQAKDLEEWLADYYLGQMEYQVEYRGDPRIDANDLFYLELKNRDESIIRCYEHELRFNGSWSGKIKGRKVT